MQSWCQFHILLPILLHLLLFLSGDHCVPSKHQLLTFRGKKEFSLRMINRILMSTGPLRCPGGVPRPTTPLPQPHSQRQGITRLKEIWCDPKISQLSPVWSVSSQSHPIWTIQPSQVCQMPRAALEEARTAYGTDEDVIFIFPSSSEQWFGNFHFSC